MCFTCVLWGGARAGVGAGARGIAGAAPRLQTQIKGDRGFEGAGWTFVVAGGCAAGGRLRGDCERVRSVRADA